MIFFQLTLYTAELTAMCQRGEPQKLTKCHAKFTENCRLSKVSLMLLLILRQHTDSKVYLVITEAQSTQECLQPSSEAGQRGRSLNKFGAKSHKRFPPHLSNVSTLPCETCNAHHTGATTELLQKETPDTRLQSQSVLSHPRSGDW